VAFLEELRRGGLAAELIKPTHHQFCIHDELRGGGAQLELRPMARFAVALSLMRRTLPQASPPHRRTEHRRRPRPRRRCSSCESDQP
jgi:hypothetical protein